jgi:hypothetical protein
MGQFDDRSRGGNAMVIFAIGRRTGTDRYVNGPYRFTFTHNGLYAVLALAAVIGVMIALCR